MRIEYFAKDEIVGKDTMPGAPDSLPTQRRSCVSACVCVEGQCKPFCGRRESDRTATYPPLSPHLATRPPDAILKPIPTSTCMPNPSRPRGGWKWPGGQEDRPVQFVAHNMNTSLATWCAGRTPSAKWPTGNTKIALFLEKFDPPRQFQLAGGGGCGERKRLNVATLLAFRQWGGLAE
jgi:hypothetical protein